MRAQLVERGVGMLGDQLGEPGAIDLLESFAAHRAMGVLAVVAAALLDAAGPGRADAEGLGDLLGLHAAVVGQQDPMPQIIRVRCRHARPFPGRSAARESTISTCHAPRNLTRAEQRYA